MSDDEAWEAYRRAVVGKPYRPSSGTEGAMFMEAWCCKCIRDNYTDANPGGGCLILAATMGYDLTDEGYPKEWTHDASGDPMCTAFIERGGPNDPDTPPPFINLTLPLFTHRRERNTTKRTRHTYTRAPRREHRAQPKRVTNE